MLPKTDSPTRTSDVDPAARQARALVTALAIRRTEQRFLELFQQGRLFGTVHTCLGQEMTGVAIAQALTEGDFILSNHRCHGHYLAWTDDIDGLVAEVMGKESGTCGGRGGSQHLCKEGFYSNGVQGGMGPVGAGMALARKLAGRDRIGALFIGDGTLGEGALYEAMNLVSKWELPLLIVLENNGYAQSTSQQETLAGDIEARAAAFGIATARGDTLAWPALLDLARDTADAMRKDGKPRFLRIDTYRLGPHSKGDDNRDPAEIAAAHARDPLTQLLAANDPRLTSALAGIDARIEQAVARADASRVQSSMTIRPVPSSVQSAQKDIWTSVQFSEDRVVKLVRAALDEALAADERVFLLGEDILSPYGGAFKATQGLSDKFPGRVRNTPISEACIVGVGSGLALEGRRPVVEIMFGDFLMLAGDQWLNHAAKFRWMYNDQVEVPLIVRTPMGGRRGYGPTHSQSIEKHFLGVPGTQVLALHARWSPLETYRALFASVDRPTLVVENKMLYGQNAVASAPPGWTIEATREAFPTVRMMPVDGAANVTLIAYGGMVCDAEAALGELFAEHDLLAELYVPLRLYPLDIAPIVESVRRTGHVVVVEEGQGFGGFGGELLAQLCESVGRPFRARRVTAAPHPIPTSRPLEEQALPSTAGIVRAAVEIARG